MSKTCICNPYAEIGPVPREPNCPIHGVQSEARAAQAPAFDTTSYRLALAGEGPLAFTWKDKPHRLIYDLCREIERRDGVTLDASNLPSIASRAAQAPAEANIFEIRGTDSEVLVTLKVDGTLVYGADYHLDEAARIFWQALRDFAPSSRASLSEPQAGEAGRPAPIPLSAKQEQAIQQWAAVMGRSWIVRDTVESNLRTFARMILKAVASAPSAVKAERLTYLDVVFDGPPSHESGRFVEVEGPDGRSLNAGEWIDRGDGLWALRIGLAPAPPAGEPAPLSELVEKWRKNYGWNNDARAAFAQAAAELEAAQLAAADREEQGDD